MISPRPLAGRRSLRRPPAPRTEHLGRLAAPSPVPAAGPDARRAGRTRGAGPGTSGRRRHQWGRDPGPRCPRGGAGRGCASVVGSSGRRTGRTLLAERWVGFPAGSASGPKPLELGGYLGASCGEDAGLGAQPSCFPRRCPPFPAALARGDRGRIALPPSRQSQRESWPGSDLITPVVSSASPGFQGLSLPLPARGTCWEPPPHWLARRRGAWRSQCPSVRPAHEEPGLWKPDAREQLAPGQGAQRNQDLWAGPDEIGEDAAVIPGWRKGVNTAKCQQEFNEPGK